MLLSKNQIEFIAPGAFDMMMTLEILFLHENQLSSLRRDTFRGLKNLKKLYLYDNKLQKIEPGALDGMIRLEKIRIDKNRIHCDCGIKPAVKYLASLRERPQVRCKTPKKMMGRVIYEATDLLKCGNPITRAKTTSRVTTPKITTTTKLTTTKTTSTTRTTTSTTTTTTTTATTTTTITTTTTTTTTEAQLPKFQIRPADQIVNVNDSVIFPCQAQKEDTFIGWRRGEERLDAIGGELRLNSVQPNQSGEYTCQLINENGAVEHSAQLIVVMAPRLLPTRNQIQPLPVGSNLKRGLIRCIIESSPLGSIEWAKDGQIITPINSNGIEVVRGVNGQLVVSSLEIRNISTGHSGEYTCIGKETIHHQGQTVEKKFQLIVTQPLPPRIILGPEATRAQSGDTVSLHCEVDGEPFPTIGWFKDGNQVNLDNERITTENGFLIIQEVVTSDSGDYHCQAVNSLGQVRVFIIF